jgi:UDP-N-acetylglucosamine:LPS N-acetylglucosamine transferase
LKKVIFISSTGGHLAELLRLSPVFETCDPLIITENTGGSNINSLQKNYGEKVKFLTAGTKHSKLKYPFILAANSIKSLAIFIKFRPGAVVTTGTHTAGPMCCIAKLARKKVIYIETFASVENLSETGKLLYKFADTFIVQHEELNEKYPKALYFGGIF